MFERLAHRVGLAEHATMADVVEAVRLMPYGRPTVRTVDGALAEWRGTCSAKHALLAAVIGERWPETQPRPVHRVYRCTRARAQRNFGARAAAAVPPDGLWDVHRYLTVLLGGRRIAIDVTFPSGPSWDGTGSMPLSCGPGTDHVVRAIADADPDKRALEEAWCDPAAREPFIAALSGE